jgi:hypothetical protein
LGGEARQRYDMMRELGLSEARAMDDLIAAGLVQLSAFDAFVESFRRSGLSETAALRAAIGRDHSEGAAREAWNAGSGTASGAGTTSVVESVRPALDRAFDAAVRAAQECAGMDRERAVQWIRAEAEKTLYTIAESLHKGRRAAGESRPVRESAGRLLDDGGSAR